MISATKYGNDANNERAPQRSFKRVPELLGTIWELPEGRRESELVGDDLATARSTMALAVHEEKSTGAKPTKENGRDSFKIK